MTKINLQGLDGKYLPAEGETCFYSLDGSDVRTWLEGNGIECVSNRNTGHNGEAITKCGFCVSTNGYVYKINR